MSSAKFGDGFDWGQLHDFVAQELRKLDTSYKGPPAGPELRHSGYHEAAAVLSSFEVGVIKPNTSSPSPGTITALLSDSMVVYDETKAAAREASVKAAEVLREEVSEEDEEALRSILVARRPRWTLLPKVRRKVIEQLGSREALLAALAANERRPEDMLQALIESYLRREAPTLDSQDIAQLTCTGQIVEWFGGVLKELPTPEEVASRLDARRLLQPFEKLVGRHFSGRQEKLDKLYSYVGVLPTTRLDGVRRSAEKFFNIRVKPPLMIYGPGGVGKSTLVSKFILDHATLDRSRRFPYAYIDFDRPGLIAEEPVTLLVEAVRQLGVQYPDVRQFCDRVRRDWQETLSSVARQGQTRQSEVGTPPAPKLQPNERTRFLQDFGSLLNSMDVGDQPFLLVLDTFEEVQYRSREYISLLWNFINGFQAVVPRLRTVLSGRVPLPPKDYPTEELMLSDLDAEAARGFLTAHGVQPPDLVNKIVTRVGGSPLSLNLAVDVFFKEKKEGDPEAFFEQLKKDRIQSQLYTRILEHVHSEDLRRLAHPGLVLRRITPGLIFHVLAKPCGLKDKITNMEQANALFDELSREFTLVIPAEDGALRHMPEVRKGMIELLRDDEVQKVKVEAIQRRAIKYYRRMTDPISRAEEIYHRLALGQIGKGVAARWMPGVEPYLHSAVEELAPPQQAFLAARLKITVEDGILEKATQEDWEEIVARQAVAFLRLSQPEKALEVIERRRRRLPGSRLHLLKALALERLGKFVQALRAVEKGLSSTRDEYRLVLDLRLLGARLHSRLGRFEEARLMLIEAQNFARKSADHASQLEVALERLGLERRMGGDGPHTKSLSGQVLNLLSLTADAQLTDNLPLLRAAVGLVPDDAGLILRGVRLVGLEGASQAQLRTLARALAEWELELVSSSGQEPGALARAANVPAYGTPFDTWQSFVQTSPPPRVQEAVGALLANFKATQAILSVLSDILCLPGDGKGARDARQPGEQAVTGAEGLATGPEATPVEVSEGGVAQGRGAMHATPDFRRDLIHGLTQAFPTRAALAQMLRFRMDLNLDSISLTDDLSNAVYNLVGFASRKAILPQLLAAARDSNPEEPTLARLARGLGLTAETTGNTDEVQKLVESGSDLSFAQWYATLAQMEGRICRVEINSPSGSSFGTGFLVGPDILLTSCIVVQPLIENKVDPRRVVFRFDYKQLSDGATVSQGSSFGLTQKDWLIYHEPPPGGGPDRDSLDFALLRLEGVPGSEPIGGEKAEPGAPARGWINFPLTERTASTGPTLILHHPRGNALKFTLSTEGRGRVDESGVRVGYRLNTEPGSAGAPCFNLNWELIALHEGKQKAGWFGNIWEAIGVSSDAIRSRLTERGFAHLLGGTGLDTVRLRTGRVFLNRMELRSALSDLSLPQGRRILVVNGPPGSGKSYTVEFIRELSYNSPNLRVVYVNLGHLSSIAPADLLGEVVRQLGPLAAEMPALSAEQVPRMMRRLVQWFRLVTTRTDLWLVLDDFDPKSSQTLGDLIGELQLMAADKGSNFRLVLLNYTLPLHQSALSCTIEENISPLGLADVDAYLRQVLAEGRTEKAEADAMRWEAAALINESLKDERLSSTLNMRLSELLRKSAR